MPTCFTIASWKTSERILNPLLCENLKFANFDICSAISTSSAFLGMNSTTFSDERNILCNAGFIARTTSRHFVATTFDLPGSYPISTSPSKYRCDLILFCEISPSIKSTASCTAFCTMPSIVSLSIGSIAIFYSPTAAH